MKQWLREFLVNRTVNYPQFGLCSNISKACGFSARAAFELAIGDKKYPVYDTHAALSAEEQFARLPHYEGRQLELRLELALNVLAPDNAELSDDARKLSQWLKQFVIHRKVKDQDYGLCGNIEEDCSEGAYNLFIQAINNEWHPIHDKSAEGCSRFQYFELPKYEGRQLELRVELAIKVLEELHNEATT